MQPPHISQGGGEGLPCDLWPRVILILIGIILIRNFPVCAACVEDGVRG